MEFRVGQIVEQVTDLFEGEDPKCEIIKFNRYIVWHRHLNTNTINTANIDCFKTLGKTNPNCAKIILPE